MQTRSCYTRLHEEKHASLLNHISLEEHVSKMPAVLCAIALAAPVGATAPDDPPAIGKDAAMSFWSFREKDATEVSFDCTRVDADHLTCSTTWVWVERERDDNCLMHSVVMPRTYTRVEPNSWRQSKTLDGCPNIVVVSALTWDRDLVAWKFSERYVDTADPGDQVAKACRGPLERNTFTNSQLVSRAPPPSLRCKSVLFGR